MARGRMLNITIAGDFKLNSMSIEAEYLFLKTIPHLDRDGLVYGKPNLLWAKACPERMELFNRIDDLVQEWIDAELVMKYDTRNGPVIYFHGFMKNQGSFKYDREAPSIFDPPPNSIRGERGIVFLAEGATPDLVETPKNDTKDEVRTNSGPDPDEVPLKAKQSKGKEVNEMRFIPPTGDPDMDTATSRFVRRQNGQPIYGKQFEIAEWNLELPAKQRIPIAEAIAQVTGKRALWDADDERTRKDLHQGAITAHKMGYTADGITALADAWRKDWRGVNGGSISQFLAFLSEQASEPVKPKKRTRIVAED